MNLSKFTAIELLQLNSSILVQLKKLEIIRTSNNPVADYAEWLIARSYNLELMPNSFSSYDAIDPSTNKRYQIKSRRFNEHNRSYQLGVIRGLAAKKFDFLAAIIFNEDYTIKEAYMIPHHIIEKYSRFSKLQNGHILVLRGILQDKRIEEITLKLKKFQNES
jgi:hypothetical protein